MEGTTTSKSVRSLLI